MSEMKTEIKPKVKLLVEVLTTEDKLRIMEEKREKEEKEEEKEESRKTTWDSRKKEEGTPSKEPGKV